MTRAIPTSPTFPFSVDDNQMRFPQNSLPFAREGSKTKMDGGQQPFHVRSWNFGARNLLRQEIKRQKFSLRSVLYFSLCFQKGERGCNMRSEIAASRKTTTRFATTLLPLPPVIPPVRWIRYPFDTGRGRWGRGGVWQPSDKRMAEREGGLTERVSVELACRIAIEIRRQLCLLTGLMIFLFFFFFRSFTLTKFFSFLRRRREIF